MENDAFDSTPDLVSTVTRRRGGTPAGYRKGSPKKIDDQVDALDEPTGKKGSPAPAGFMSAGLDPENKPGLGKPSPYLIKALAKKPADRTPQEAEALKVRSRAEEITSKNGGKVVGGIMSDLIAEERAPDIGRREAKAAVGYYDASAETLKNAGRAPDGSKLDPALSSKTTPVKEAGAAAPQAAPAAAGNSGGTITKDGKTTTVPGAPATVSAAKGPVSPPLPEGATPAVPQGFAMRTMPDGTIRTASGLNAAGSSNIHDFSTRDAAMAFYRPAPAPMPSQPLPGPGAPPQAYAPPATQAGVAAPAPAPAAPPAPPAPAPQTPAAARTTSPTAKLEMAGGTPGAATSTPVVAPPAAGAPSAPPAAPSPAPAPIPTVGGQPIATPLAGGGFDLTPGLEARRAQDAANPPIATPLPGGGMDLMPGIIARRAQGASPIKNPFTPDRPQFDLGTPKHTGFQEDSGKLTVENPFG